MQFVPNSQIKSKEKIIQFLKQERIGRVSTIDVDGFPFIAPMNFVYHNDVIYIHGFPRGGNMKIFKEIPNAVLR